MNMNELAIAASLSLAAVGAFTMLAIARGGTLRAARRRPKAPTRRPPLEQRLPLALQAYAPQVRVIRENMRFPMLSFERECLTVLVALAKDPRYSDPRALLLPLERTRHALALRRAVLLPPAVAAEDIEPRSHRWTYGVFLAAMLLDVVADALPPGSTTCNLNDTLGAWLQPESLRWLCEDTMLVDHLARAIAQPKAEGTLNRIIRVAQHAARHTHGASPADDAIDARAHVIDILLAPDRAFQPPAVHEATRAVPVAPTSPAPTAAATAAPTHAPATVPATAPRPPAPSASTITDQPRTMRCYASPEPEMAHTVTRDADLPAPRRRDPPDLGDPVAIARDVMAWLRDSVASGELSVNNSDSLVHFGAEGMILICPDVFVRYAVACEAGDTGESALAPLDKVAANAVVMAGWYKRDDGSGTAMRRYRIASSQGPRTVKCMIVARPERWFASVPPRGRSLTQLM